jgi:drug/metabolite transporter (DMT)-like permease
MKNDRVLAFAAFVTVCIVWGTTYLGIRVAVETIPPVLLTGVRYTIAAIGLLTISRLRGERIPSDPRTIGRIAIVALLLIGVGNFGVVWAEQWVPSGMAALLVASAPFWATILEALRRGGERIRFRRMIGIAVGFAGVAILVTPRGAGHFYDAHFVLGAIAIQIAAIAWQGGSLYGKLTVNDVPPLMSTGLQALIAGIVLDVIGLAIGEAPRFHPSARSLIALLYLAIVGTMLAYSAYMYALSRMRITTMSLYTYVNPIVAVILGWLVLGERLTPVSIAGMAIILFGMILVREPAVIDETEEQEQAA